MGIEKEMWLRTIVNKKTGLKNLHKIVYNFFEIKLESNQLPVVQAMLDPEAKNIFAMMARQGGKSQCIAMFNALAPMFFDNINIYTFAPKLEQAQISFERASAKIHRNKYNIYGGCLVMDKVDRIKFSNGTEIRALSASLNSEIEGLTAHIIILDESQLLSTYKVQESIYPMGGAVDAKIIHFGVPRVQGTHFYDAFRSDQYKKFIYPWNECPRLKKDYIKSLNLPQEIFDTQYNLQWVSSAGMFISRTDFEACEVENFDVFEECKDKDFKGEFLGIDFAKQQDSTVGTEIKRVNNSQDYVISNWWELQGTDYAQQIGFIKSEMYHPGIMGISADKSSVGDAVIDVLKESGLPIEGVPFDISRKDKLYKTLRFLIQKRKIHWVKSDTKVYRRFKQQLLDLEVDYKSSGLMTVHHPAVSGAMDDFADSLALAVWSAENYVEPRGYFG